MMVFMALTTSIVFCKLRTTMIFCDIGVERYKVGDPVIFNETQRFGQEIHNNVKGKIIDF